MADIFVCYRRADSRGDAGRLADSLDKGFRHSQVFRDVESLEGGVDFKSVIKATIARCVVLLAVIGPRWLDLKGTSGSRRLDNQDDFIRLEISYALEQGITVIPVLVGGASMPAREALPAPLQALAGCQAMELSDSRWDFDVARLIDRLSELPGLRPPPWTRLVSLAPRRAWLRWTAMLVAVIVVFAGVTQFAVVNDDPALDSHHPLLDVDLASAPWAEGDCLYPTDCNSRDGRQISSMIRLLGSEVRTDSQSDELHVLLSIQWVLREGTTNLFHRGYTGKMHYTAAWQRSAATGAVVLGELQLQRQSMAPFNGLLAFTLGCIEIPWLATRDRQVRAEIKRRLERSSVVQALSD